MTVETDTKAKVDAKPLPFPMPSNEDVQKYIRIVIYWFSGFITGHGILDSTWAPVIIGVGTAAANFGWTLYGGRLIAKLNEIAKYDEVQRVQMKPAAVVEKPSLISDTGPKVTTAPHTNPGTAP